MNAQSGERAWPRDEIARAEPTATMWIIPNGLRVTLREGKTEKFVVQGRAAWVEALSRLA